MIKSSDNSVCAVVLTYNRKDLLYSCITSIFEQTFKPQTILVLDNASTDGTEVLLEEKCALLSDDSGANIEPFSIIKTGQYNNIKIIYKKLIHNSGSSGGFYNAIKSAHALGHSWLFITDDDVTYEKNAIEKMYSATPYSKCIQSSKDYPNGEMFHWNGGISERSGRIFSSPEKFSELNRFYTVNFGCFEGMLISSELIDKIGYPKKEFFMYGDDTYYGFKASKFTQVMYLSDLLVHKQLDKRNETKVNENILQAYLIYRNLTYVAKKVSNCKLCFYFQTFVVVSRGVLASAIKRRNYKVALVKVIGVIHGVKAVWGYEKRFLK